MGFFFSFQFFTLLFVENVETFEQSENCLRKKKKGYDGECCTCGSHDHLMAVWRPTACATN